jgi:hypothetical protein
MHMGAELGTMVFLSQLTDGGALGGRWTGVASVQPRIHQRELVILQLLPVELPAGPDPREGGHVCDRVAIVDDEVAAFEALLEHAQQALRLVAVAFSRVRVLALVLGEPVEVPELAEHGADAPHLPHEPLNRLPFVNRVLRQELPGLLRKVEQNGAALEHGDRLPVWTVGVDDRRDLGVRVDLDELRRKRLVLPDVDGMRLILNPHFFQRYPNLHHHPISPSSDNHPNA